MREHRSDISHSHLLCCKSVQSASLCLSRMHMGQRVTTCNKSEHPLGNMMPESRHTHVSASIHATTHNASAHSTCQNSTSDRGHEKSSRQTLALPVPPCALSLSFKVAYEPVQVSTITAQKQTKSTGSRTSLPSSALMRCGAVGLLTLIKWVGNVAHFSMHHSIRRKHTRSLGHRFSLVCLAKLRFP